MTWLDIGLLSFVGIVFSAGLFGLIKVAIFEEKDLKK